MNMLPTPPFQAVLLEHTRGLRLVGELDLATIGDLQTMLATLPPGPDPVTLDLADLAFMDVSGLHAIEGYAATLNGARPLLLVNVPQHIHRVFELTGAAGNPSIQLGLAP